MKRIFGLTSTAILVAGLASAQSSSPATGNAAPYPTTERTERHDNDFNLGWLGLLGLAGLLPRRQKTVVRTEHGNSRAYTPEQ